MSVRDNFRPRFFGWLVCWFRGYHFFSRQPVCGVLYYCYSCGRLMPIITAKGAD